MLKKFRAKSGFLLINLLIYSIVIGFLLIVLGVGVQLIVKASAFSKKLDKEIELLAAVSLLEQDIKNSDSDPKHWLFFDWSKNNQTKSSSKKDVSSEIIFALKDDQDNKNISSAKLLDNNLLSCCWQVKKGFLRRITGNFSYKNLSWKQDKSISVLSSGVTGIKFKLFVTSNKVKGVKVFIKTENGKTISSLIKLRCADIL